MRSFGCLVGVAAVFLFAATPALAQSSGIAGVVRDTSGAVLPGVTVEAASPALIEGTRSLTWREFFHTRNRLASSLAALGVAQGEHAVIYAHNSAENLIASAAIRALGAIAVPLNHRLTAEEVAYILDNADATTLFVGDAFLPMVERVRDAAGVRRFITLGAERRPWAETYDDLLARGSREAPPPPAAVGGSMVYTAEIGRASCRERV